MNTQEVTLRIERFNASASLPANFESEVHEDACLGRVLRMWAEMPTLQMQRHIAKYPRDWKQAFKERWAPGWFLRRWPVIYTEEVFDARLAYPDHKLEPTLGRSFPVLLRQR